MILILKPRFLPAIYVKALEDGLHEVKLLGKTIEVKTKDLRPGRLP